MIKNRITQIVFQTVYCTLAIIAVLTSLGLFNGKFNSNFYVYYTNLSNYICFGLMFVILAKTIISFKKNAEGCCNTTPKFNFLCVILILVTLLVYNILLAKDNSAFEYFTSLNNLLMHLILPIMFILNWVIFYEHRKLKWYFPLLSLIMPLIYICFILIRAAILKGSGAILYPYFFLNADKLGWGGFFMWVSILIVIFLFIGYILYFLDNIAYFKQKFKMKKEQNKNSQM